MATSILGFALLSTLQTPSLNYKNIKITQNSDQSYTATTKGQTYSLLYHPSSIEPLIPTAVDLSGTYLMITSDINQTEEAQKFIALAKFWTTQLEQTGIITAQSFTTSYNDQPGMTCQNATISTRVIYFTIGNTTEIINQDNCIIISGSSSFELMQARDAFITAHMLNLRN